VVSPKWTLLKTLVKAFQSGFSSFQGGLFKLLVVGLFFFFLSVRKTVFFSSPTQSFFLVYPSSNIFGGRFEEVG